jgi:hypothetical protein
MSRNTGRKTASRGRQEQNRPSLVSSLVYYGLILAAGFVLLLHVYYVVSARKLEFAIGRVIQEQRRVRKEIAGLEIEISRLESIPNLLARKNEETIPLAPPRSPSLPYLVAGDETNEG